MKVVLEVLGGAMLVVLVLVAGGILYEFARGLDRTKHERKQLAGISCKRARRTSIPRSLRSVRAL
jgi:hypothetical protein